MRALDIHVGLVLLIAASSLKLLASAEAVSKKELTNDPLKFNKDGTFHISIFGDLHFGESQYSLPFQFLTSLAKDSEMRLTPRKKMHGINGVLNKIYTLSRSSKRSSTRIDQT